MLPTRYGGRVASLYWLENRVHHNLVLESREYDPPTQGWASGQTLRVASDSRGVLHGQMPPHSSTRSHNFKARRIACISKFRSDEAILLFPCSPTPPALSLPRETNNLQAQSVGEPV